MIKKSDLITQILANIPKPSVGISTAEFVKKENKASSEGNL